MFYDPQRKKHTNINKLLLNFESAAAYIENYTIESYRAEQISCWTSWTSIFVLYINNIIYIQKFII